MYFYNSYSFLQSICGNVLVLFLCILLHWLYCGMKPQIRLVPPTLVSRVKVELQVPFCTHVQYTLHSEQSSLEGMVSVQPAPYHVRFLHGKVILAVLEDGTVSFG